MRRVFCVRDSSGIPSVAAFEQLWRDIANSPATELFCLVETPKSPTFTL
jgi:hypothetical protein